ncbi:hypothetical protein AB0G20_18410 [Streptomyces sp. NPDC024017]|uniref:hypothetical protein n=1 Tax=Streptomyces sp. NPDC024017 TaxID=3154326 RepID=UPI0033FC6F74
MPESTPRARGHLVDWLGALLAAAALAVSCFSLAAARGANDEAAKANTQAKKAKDEADRLRKRESAALVDFIVWGPEDPAQKTVQITNRSSTAITDVILTFKGGRYLNIGAIPSCHRWELANLTQLTTDGETVTLTVARLDFADSEDPKGRWTYITHLKPRTHDPENTEDIKPLFKDHYSLTDGHCADPE